MNRLLAALCCLLLPFPATGRAEGPVRHAILVGSNHGRAPRRPLRYAGQDAQRLAQALREVGGFAPGHVTVLVDPEPADLQQAMARVGRAIDRQRADREALVLFYYSGHSDGINLELGDGSVPFVAVREWLDECGARIRLAIVDSCLSGQLIGIKGVHPVPPFQVLAEGSLKTEGTVVLTSSAAGELAQESSEIRGAFFTHHLVSALYGAADEDEDLAVSLEEAYRYAYRRTVGDTVRTVAGTQHPGYSKALEGYGALILSRLTGQAATLLFPETLDGLFFVLDEASGAMVAEVMAGEREVRLHLPAGRYVVAHKVGDTLDGATVQLARRGQGTVDPAGFATLRTTLADARGGEARYPVALLAAYALSGWLLPEMGPLHAAGLLGRWRLRHVELQARMTLGATSVNDNGFRYDMQVTEGALAALFRIPLYQMDILLGPVLGTSRLAQDSSIAGRHVAWSLDAGILAGISLELRIPLALLVAWEADVHVFSQDGSMTGNFAPKALLGVGYAF